jgi:hypothetical protein
LHIIWFPSRRVGAQLRTFRFRELTPLRMKKAFQSSQLLSYDSDLKGGLICRAYAASRSARPARGGIDLGTSSQAWSHNQKLSRHHSRYSHLAAGIASKSVKLQRPARATVCSHSLGGCARQCRTCLVNTRSCNVVKIARLKDATYSASNRSFQSLHTLCLPSASRTP